jgi:hypothetical protein
MPRVIKFALTAAQKKVVAPLVEEHNKMKTPGMIFAQLDSKHICATLVDHDTAVRIIAAKEGSVSITQGVVRKIESRKLHKEKDE